MATIRLMQESTDFHTGYLFDKNISLQAKGLLAFLAFAPGADECEEWDAKSIAERIGEGVAAVRSALKELEHAGYLHRCPVAYRGQIASWIYEVYDMPWIGGGAE